MDQKVVKNLYLIVKFVANVIKQASCFIFLNRVIFKDFQAFQSYERGSREELEANAHCIDLLIKLYTVQCTA